MSNKDKLEKDYNKFNKDIENLVEETSRKNSRKS